jgi:CMP/dCMP kinase
MVFIISIDGVSGSGKGTLAKRLSERYNCSYLPTGNIYRAVAKKYLEYSSDPQLEEKKLLDIAENITVHDIYDLNLRSDEIAKLASIIADKSRLRETLNEFQRNWCQNQKIAIIEGRDIGTTICPDADIKIYLIADIKTRASRRYQELKTISNSADEDIIRKELSERDFRDSHRTFSPATQPKDAYIIDTSELDIEGMVEKTAGIIENKLTRH